MATRRYTRCGKPERNWLTRSAKNRAVKFGVSAALLPAAVQAQECSGWSDRAIRIPRILVIASTLLGGRHNGAVRYEDFASMQLNGVFGYGRLVRERSGQTSGKSPGQKGPVICS